MRRKEITLAGNALLGLLAPGLLGGQICAGSPSLKEARFGATAAVADYAYATAVGASFTTGKAVYGTLGVGTTYDREQDARTYDISVIAGADVADSARRVYLCPLAAFALSLGPYDYLLTSTNYRYLDAALGFGVAVVATRSPPLAVMPAVGVRLARITVSYIPSAAQREQGARGWTRGDTYWLWSLAVGVGIGKVLTVRPSVTVPFGLVAPGQPDAFAVPFGREEGDVSLGISVGIGFGRRKR